MISSLLIANRGEIACRIIRTARAMGVRTVAVYSDADARALHVRQADEAAHIGPSPAAESYLRGDRIIAAAKETGAEAIHPGYGFLSENADFAQAVIDAGLVWVGPRPDSIRAMGLKDAAKTLMQDAGVPVTPGYMGEDQSPDRLLAEAEAIGWPVLIKAVAGGGGKGMRKVDAPADFLSALESCRREAAASFGNDTVLLEKFIESPRHIEVQVFGDAHGNVVHLFERDCSLQRRHQKVIEEAPAPGMDAATREAICGAAVRAAKAVDYVGAGTIEFIADASAKEGGGLSADRIWFMEMNTRLQVEHPVTEEITGVDLVEWQLRVASGEELPLRQEELRIDGWAMEARLYAEDPAKGFLPSTGELTILNIEKHALRNELGVVEGDAITPFYDPMIAKSIAHAASRSEAIFALGDGLSGFEVWPVRTNAGFLLRCLKSEDFRSGRLSTGLIDAHLDELTAVPDDVRQALLDDAAAGLIALEFSNIDSVYGTLSNEAAGAGNTTPFRSLINFRLNTQPRAQMALTAGTEAELHELPADFMNRFVSVARVPNGIVAFAEGEAQFFATRPSADAAGATADGAILAPMPGKVIAVDVAEGETVSKGQRLLVLEAMKMEHALTAPFDGAVVELKVGAGDQVQVEALLARVEKAGE